MKDEINTVYHTPIKVRPVCKNGSGRLGYYAFCAYALKKNSKVRIDVEQHAKTDYEARFKLNEFLSNGNQYTTIEI